MSRVTVLIPTYNRSKFIEHAIKSCFMQTYKDFSILVYDDGSTDDTENIISKLTLKHKNIKYIKGSKNMGIGYSRQILLDNLETEYGVWLDSDDLMKSDRLKKCVDYMDKNKTTEIVYSDIQRFTEPLRLGQIIAIDITKYDKNNFRSLNSNTACATAFFRKGIKKYKFESEMRDCAEDVLWLWRLLCNDVKVGHIKECLYLYRSHNERAGILKRKRPQYLINVEQAFLATKIKEYQNG